MQRWARVGAALSSFVTRMLLLSLLALLLLVVAAQEATTESPASDTPEPGCVLSQGVIMAPGGGDPCTCDNWDSLAASLLIDGTLYDVSDVMMGRNHIWIVC